MTSFSKFESIRGRLASLSILVLLAAAPAWGQAGGGGDVTLDSAQRILGLALDERSQDGRTVRVAMRTLRDPALVPLFELMLKSEDPSTRLDASVSLVLATKDPKRLSVATLLATKDDGRIGGALAQLIDLDLITNEQLEEVVKAGGLDPAHTVMAASELLRRKALPDHALLLKQLDRGGDTVGRYDIVRHYAAITLLENKNDAENAAALKCLTEMGAVHSPRLEGVQELMLLRVFRDKLALAGPWVEALAKDRKCSPRLRQTATATLLALKNPAGVEALTDLIKTRKDVGDQITYGLSAIEFADRLKAEDLNGLGVGASGQKLGSPLAKAVTDLATKAVGGGDVDHDLLALVKQGQPIVLNWALGYSASAAKPRQLAIRLAVIEQASILDEVRGADFERAAIAANRIVEDNGADGRKALGQALKSTNRAAVEAVLLGMLRSNVTDVGPLVSPIWEELVKSQATENAANYAALLLAREGRKEPLSWLAGMIQGGTVQNIGFRALAAWQYAKLKEQGAAVIERLAAKKR